MKPIDRHSHQCKSDIMMKGIPQTPFQLYKYLLRQIPNLPKESQPYYRNYVKGVCILLRAWSEGFE